jgi:hypothetical protein
MCDIEDPWGFDTSVNASWDWRFHVDSDSLIVGDIIELDILN